ncbi:hypothetical protein LEP1GSC105_2889 [Leptospira interrogans str. UI 12758]|uniref:Uncharacterized protein n=1 Tax=Leptospira interrogans str. UI 12758 TaxID=1049938 RepID=A0A0E2D3X1_LEPIR|nr:hypothetical protein LEP1GSC105_2889 [Leptospira interrogans str. UI 12758]EMN65648.1 hypothetical protein LEP1GSC098_2888 [Leptospira interrogans serovar Grippotyphosa str. UI 08434]
MNFCLSFFLQLSYSKFFFTLLKFLHFYGSVQLSTVNFILKPYFSAKDWILKNKQEIL